MRPLTPWTLLAALILAVPVQAETVALTGARIHTMGPTGVIDNGTVVIGDGRITAIGAGLAPPPGARVIDASGGVITPGLYDAHGYLGVTEVSLEASTVDRQHVDPRYSAAFEVADAINPRSVLIPINRIEGVTRALVTPAVAPPLPGQARSPVAGLGSVIHLGGSEDFIVGRNAALYADLGESGATAAGGSRSLALLRLREALEDARDLAANRKAWNEGARRPYSASRPDLEALAETLRSGRPVVVTVHRASDIAAALRLAEDFGLNLVISGGSEAWLVAGPLAAAGVPVIIDPIENLPRRFEALGATLENAARLHAAGVTVAFATFRSHNARNMRQAAGNAVAHGLPWDAALAALTVNPARIFGQAASSGSLEARKDADLVLWDGDPLEVTTTATRVFIRGRDIPMVSRHTLLRDRYRDISAPLPPQYRPRGEAP
ncbi:MAG TPA: amidohydrolase family protein [Gammaproteobacteria bacterium]|nr:amidohydrolase family protein [Gammaproteobacteria bacterium]